MAQFPLAVHIAGGSTHRAPLWESLCWCFLPFPPPTPSPLFCETPEVCFPVEPGQSALLEALLHPWLSLESIFGSLDVFVGLGRDVPPHYPCSPGSFVAPHCSSSLLLPPLRASLNLDAHPAAHLVCFSPTKSHCLLGNPCSGEVAPRRERSELCQGSLCCAGKRRCLWSSLCP